jgi:tetratricopeptide (TPR) repeat protein
VIPRWRLIRSVALTVGAVCFTVLAVRATLSQRAAQAVSARPPAAPAPAAPAPSPVSAGQAAYLRGVERAQAGQDALALEEFKAAIARDPDHLEAYRYAGWIQLKLRDWDGAVSHWTRYLERHPDSGRAFCERGGARYRRGDREDALADARRACELGWTPCCAVGRSAPPRE